MRDHDKLLRRRKVILALIEGRFIKRFEYSWDIPENLPEQFLLLSNHEAYLDPVMMYITFPDHFFYFLVGEQVSRSRLLGTLARFFGEPITVMRHVNDVQAVRRALSIIRQGGSVGLYPAGEREWDGHALPIAPSIGKFVKMSKIPLVTFNVEGMYFVNPRWGAHMRHLPTHGRVVGVYDAETLASMTAQEVTELVRRDLTVDSTAWRASLDQPTRGSALATWLETVLYLCPRCGQINTLHTQADTIACDCGFSTRYTDRDVFDEGAPFHTVHEWNLWQRNDLQNRLSRDRDSVILSVKDASLYAIRPAESQTLVTRGDFSLGATGIACGEWNRPFSDIRGLAPLESDRLILTVGDGHFEIRHKRPWNIVGFSDLYNLLKAADRNLETE